MLSLGQVYFGKVDKILQYLLEILEVETNAETLVLLNSNLHEFESMKSIRPQSIGCLSSLRDKAMPNYIQWVPKS